MKKFLLVFLMLCGAGAHAETHRWIDERGKVQYSDRPPVGVEATVLRAVSTPASGVGANKTFAEREAELKKAQQKKKEAADLAAQKQANTEIEKSNCAAARQRMTALQSGARMSEYDANGEVRFLEDNERQQRSAQAQDDIAKFCK